MTPEKMTQGLSCLLVFFLLFDKPKGIIIPSVQVKGLKFLNVEATDGYSSKRKKRLN